MMTGITRASKESIFSGLNNLKVVTTTSNEYAIAFGFMEEVKKWFDETEEDYNDFVEALLLGDLDAMNDYMNLVAQQMFHSFDTGKKSSRSHLERFYQARYKCICEKTNLQIKDAMVHQIGWLKFFN